MKLILLIALSTLCFAASEPAVSLTSLRSVEASINDRIRSNIAEPYDLLGPARATYLEGYGAVITVELNLIVVSPLTVSPFAAAPPTEETLKGIHDRKVRKLEVLKDSMRSLMLSACRQLPGLPPGEHVVMEAFLVNYRWENQKGLAHRIKMTADRQKLLDLAAHSSSPAQLATAIQDEEL